MKPQLRFPALTRAVIGSIAVSLFALGAYASDHSGQVTEKFHQTYPIAADGSVELDNINGDVHISTWDRNEVKVDAVKYADSKERLDEAQIQVDTGKSYISIRTKYPDHNLTFNSHWHNNPASVEYTLTVPRAIRLDEIKLINGGLDISGVKGDVHASCINGRLEAHNLTGRTELSTVNGRLQANFDELASTSVDLNSVNGALELTIPSDSNARLEAETVSGGIENDFGLHVNNHHFVGHNLSGELGNGGAHIKLANVNGRIEIRHASDGKSMSPVKDLSHQDRDNDDHDSEI
jgi:DUF4097 and DUF4098 domain-containing protein YvlB